MFEPFVYDWWTAGVATAAVALLAIGLMVVHIKWPPRISSRAIGTEWVRNRRRR